MTTTTAAAHGRIAKPRAIAVPLQSEVAKSADFSTIRYSQSWEDPRNLQRALQPKSHHTILSIAAAGDNSFALLLQGAGTVVSVDLNPAQVALVELKRAAIRRLEYGEFIAFLGVTPTTAEQRITMWKQLRSDVPQPTREFFDRNEELIGRGVIHVGKLEGMMRTFRTRIVPLLHSRRTIDAAFTPRDRDGRAEFYDQRFANRRWRTIIRLFFSEPVIARLGRDPAFFEHVQLDVGKHYSDRCRHAFVELEPVENQFLQYIMYGRYLSLTDGHPYLVPANFQKLRSRLDDLHVHCVELESFLHELPHHTFHGFNLSDIFEWMSDDLHLAMMRALVRTATPGARIAYWNNLVPRSCPTPLLDMVQPHPELAHAIHHDDRSFLYRDFHVDEVICDPRLVMP